MLAMAVPVARTSFPDNVRSIAFMKLSPALQEDCWKLVKILQIKQYKIITDDNSDIKYLAVRHNLTLPREATLRSL